MMDEYLIDFDKIFEAYVVEWYSEHAEEYESIDAVEEIMPDIYAQWADAPCKQLGGIAPREFFANIDDAQKLVDILIATAQGDSNPCSLLLDRIAQVPKCAEYLQKLISDSESTKLTMLSMNLLCEMQAPHPIKLYVERLFEPTFDQDARELCIEILSDNADEAAPLLYPMLSKADKHQREYIAEILVRAKPDDRTYHLLIELFEKGDNIPLYAGYIGKYGDERAMPVLYKALDNSNYLEFIEIKNAIERMGGIVDENYKDFSQDPYYRAIKLAK